EELARFALRVTDIVDDHIGAQLAVRELEAAHPIRDSAVACSLARGKPTAKYVLRRRHQDGDHIGVTPARCADDGARAVADHRPASLDIEVDGEGNSVHMAVRAPPDRKGAVGRRLLEGGRRHVFIAFEDGGRPRDHAGGKNDVRVAAARRAGVRDQRILAGAARSDHQHQPPGTDRFRSGPQGAQSCHNAAHATRRPPRHIVGAGGIGLMLYESIRNFQYAGTAAQVIIVVVTGGRYPAARLLLSRRARSFMTRGVTATHDSGSLRASRWFPGLWRIRLVLAAVAVAFGALWAVGAIAPATAGAGFALVAAAVPIGTAKSQPAPAPLPKDEPSAPRIGDPLIEAMLAALPDPVVALDHRGDVVALNARAATIAPALRPGESVSLGLRVPEVLDAIRQARAGGGAHR